jgi:hypothetical protein
MGKQSLFFNAMCFYVISCPCDFLEQPTSNSSIRDEFHR